MVITTYTLGIAETQTLNVFDDVTHMAFGDNTSDSNIGQTALGNELLRVPASATKNTGTNVYSFVGRVPITKLNSSTINEIGLFNASSGGNMAVRTVLDTGLTKTDDDELVIAINIEINTKNT